ncbi:MAG: ribosome small subunit-dependent GTPase A [Anaerolineales bacterium]|nr:ribosome small subunit-dependent GTPase A [Anaerolineales bacterium]
MLDQTPGAESTSLLCEVRGRLLQERGKDTLVAVGDRVWVQPIAANKGQIERIDPRTSVLSRQHPGIETPAEDVILANPDQAVIVFAAARPEPHVRMLDRFLVVAEANQLPVTIVANKIDLVGLAAAEAIFGLYAHIGYQVIYASAEQHIGIDALRDLLADRISVLAGPSGVGKSSLLNAVEPDLQIKTGELRDFMDKGKHTTRAAHLLPLPFGTNTYVADTPGIRELGLYDIDPSNLPFYFREMAPFLHACHYPGCTHDHEPDCAVLNAVADGVIAPSRYDSYRRLLKGEE